MFKTKRTVSLHQDHQSVRLLMAGAFKLTSEDWMQTKDKTKEKKANYKQVVK
jgi:hypothetical protein